MNIVQLVEPLFESNCYILCEGGHCVIIDPCDAVQILGAVEKEKITVDYIFLTHEHYDHVEGLNEIRANYPMAKVIASKACSMAIQKLHKNIDRTFKVYLYFMGKTCESVPNDYHCEAADIEFSGDFVLDWEGHKCRFLEIPGHSKGSILIDVDQEYILTGDSLLYGKEIVTKFLGGNPKQYEGEVKPILRQIDPEITILPGHGKRFVRKEKIIE